MNIEKSIKNTIENLNIFYQSIVTNLTNLTDLFSTNNNSIILIDSGPIKHPDKQDNNQDNSNYLWDDLF